MDKKEIEFLLNAMKEDMKEGLVYPSEWLSLAEKARQVDKKLSNHIMNSLAMYMEKINNDK